MFNFSQRSLALLVLGLALGWMVLSRVPPQANPAHAPPAPQKGFTAPDFTLETTNGEMITLTSLRGKPVMLNFWASWCPPCRAEMPSIQTIFERYGDQVVFLGINATSQDSLTSAYQLIDELDLTFSILLDTSGTVGRAYRVFSLPTTFFIDRQGVIREIVVGGPLSEAGLRARLDPLLGEGR